MFRNDVFVFVEQQHLGGGVHVEGGPEIEAEQIRDAAVDEGGGAVLGVDEWVVADVDPVGKAFFFHIVLPGLWFEIVADGEDFKAKRFPSFVDALKLGHFLLAMATSALPNAQQGVFRVDVV